MDATCSLSLGACVTPVATASVVPATTAARGVRINRHGQVVGRVMGLGASTRVFAGEKAEIGLFDSFHHEASQVIYAEAIFDRG